MARLNRQMRKARKTRRRAIAYHSPSNKSYTAAFPRAVRRASKGRKMGPRTIFTKYTTLRRSGQVRRAAKRTSRASIGRGGRKRQGGRRR